MDGWSDKLFAVWIWRGMGSRRWDVREGALGWAFGGKLGMELQDFEGVWWEEGQRRSVAGLPHLIGFRISDFRFRVRLGRGGLHAHMFSTILSSLGYELSLIRVVKAEGGTF